MHGRSIGTTRASNTTIPRESMLWLLAALLTLPILAWWGVGLAAGLPSTVSLLPFLLPIVFAIRSIGRWTRGGQVMTGAIFGIGLSVASGRGVVFLGFGIVALIFEAFLLARSGQQVVPAVLRGTAGMLAIVAISMLLSLG